MNRRSACLMRELAIVTVLAVGTTPTALARITTYALSIHAITVDNEPQLVDHCVGGTVHELVGQANLLVARQYPEYGLSERLALLCPRMVWKILQDTSLDADGKRRAFSGLAPSDFPPAQP